MPSAKRYYCEKCGRTLQATEFYTSKRLDRYPNDGKLLQCRKCLTMHVDNWDPSTFLWILEEIDVPWIPEEWNKLMVKYAVDPTKVSGTTILGRYLAKMKLRQWNKYSWADSNKIREEEEEKSRELMRERGMSEDQIEEALAATRYVVPESTKEQYDALGGGPEVNEYGILAAAAVGSGDSLRLAANKNAHDNAQAGPEPQVDLGLTSDDVTYLSLKWGKNYSPDEWVWLEKFYNDMCNSYDIQTAGHKDTLKLICKTSLKCNQLVDLGDMLN